MKKKDAKKELKLTIEDVRSQGNASLYYACSNGHMDIIEYLRHGFKLTTKDAKTATQIITFINEGGSTSDVKVNFRALAPKNADTVIEGIEKNDKQTKEVTDVKKELLNIYQGTGSSDSCYGKTGYFDAPYAYVKNNILTSLTGIAVFIGLGGVVGKVICDSMKEDEVDSDDSEGSDVPVATDNA